MDAGKTIFSMHGGARGKVTGGSDKTVNDKTIAWHGISHRTKLNIKQEWERQKRFHGRTQEDLAAYLNISQGAVSKLLNDQAGHPWSIDKIELFARFCDVPLADLIGDAELVDDVDGRRGTDALPTARQVNQARAALRRFVEDHGAALDEASLHRLAGLLALRMGSTDRSDQSYNREIMKLLIAEAGSWGSLL
jgi:transcriptional regulator with XRE-family HTH domain